MLSGDDTTGFVVGFFTTLVGLVAAIMFLFAVTRRHGGKTDGA